MTTCLATFGGRSTKQSSLYHAQQSIASSSCLGSSILELIDDFASFPRRREIKGDMSGTSDRLTVVYYQFVARRGGALPEALVSHVTTFKHSSQMML